MLVVYVVTIATACFPLINVIPSMADRCLPHYPVWYATGSLSIITDFLIILLPLPSIWKLRIPNKRQKAVLLIIFSLGFL
jgi:hypothetical protein